MLIDRFRLRKEAERTGGAGSSAASLRPRPRSGTVRAPRPGS